MVDQPIGWHKITVVAWEPIYDLKHYEADNFEQAAANSQEWYRDGTAAIIDSLSSGKLNITVEVVDGEGLN